jgi:hypothetical protein
MSQDYAEFDEEAACAAMQEEIEWQLEEWKQERLKRMEVMG